MYQVSRLYNTIKYLKIKQIYYRIYYLLRGKIRKLQKFKYPFFIEQFSESVVLQDSINSYLSYKNGQFVFLNLSHNFKQNIDWNFSFYGKLWTYNLTYFEFLNQKDMTEQEGISLINDFIHQIETIHDGLEPFPISLRGINWIKFLTKYKIKNKKIDSSLYAQYMILTDNLEYHLLGNHLLENAFSLLFGAYYFKDDALYEKSKKLLLGELNEQILDDGAHFELSPMYHQIMLFRILDCINLVSNNKWKNNELLEFLTPKAEIMLGWLEKMTFNNGSIPLFNDSTNKIAPTTEELKVYGKKLRLKPKAITLSSSGYRKFENKNYELVVDVGNIGPDYIPGHAHSDTFNFELYVGGSPLIVDTGLSTYETNEKRTLERSTQSHNTVMINNQNQSEVWGGFRVAKRAKVINIQEGTDFVKATHNGYKCIGLMHTRTFTAFEDKIIIEDKIDGNSQSQAVAYLHFYPGIEPIINGLYIKTDVCTIKVNSDDIKIKEYLYAPEFNKYINAKVIEVRFKKNLKMELKI